MTVQSQSQKGRVALITGANKGLGLETARQLGRMGATVLVGARDEARGREATKALQSEKIDAKFVPLDVTDASSVANAAKFVAQEFGRLDILINNAGIALTSSDGPASTTTPDIFRRTFDVNVFGVVSVTQAMLPLLRKSTAGRIVNLSSILGSIAEHADPNSPIYAMKFAAYDTSKAALNMYTNHLAIELRGTPIKVNAAHPGWVKTDMGGPEAPMNLDDGVKTGLALATLDADGPTGGFYHMGVHMRW